QHRHVQQHHVPAFRRTGAIVRSRPACIAGAVFVLALAGCAGDDDDASTATTSPPAAAPSTIEGTTEAPATTSAATSPAEAGDGPNATVAPGLPDVYEGEMGPVEVQGSSLPELPDSSRYKHTAGAMAAAALL